MKVIFLDHDGVICLGLNFGSRKKKRKKAGVHVDGKPTQEYPIKYRFDNFDQKAVKILNKILVETDAEIVISSDWRLYATVEELGEYYELFGIIKKPIGETERFHKINNKNQYTDMGSYHHNEVNEYQRSIEIKHYLETHPEITEWVAIDDLDMRDVLPKNGWRGEYKRNWGLNNFVLTSQWTEGIKQNGIKEKVYKFFTQS